MSTSSHLSELDALNPKDSSPIAEFADRVAKYTAAVEAGQMTTDEFKELLTDLEILKESAEGKKEQQAVQQIHDITQALVSILSKL